MKIITYFNTVPPTTLKTFELSKEVTYEYNEVVDDSQEIKSAVLFYIAFSAIFFIGLLGNSVLVLIFVRHKDMRTAPNSYILNLAVSDLITTLNCILTPFMDALDYNYPSLCKLSQLTVQTLMNVIAFTLIALSVERYCAIVHPFHKKVSTNKCTLTVIITIWIVSLAYNCGKMFLLAPQRRGKCVPMFDPDTYILTDFLLWYVIPLSVFAYCYIRIAMSLYFCASPLSKDILRTSTSPTVCATKKKVAIMALILVAMYAVCCLPFNITTMKLYFDGNYTHNKRNASINTLLLCVGCLHNSFNPIVLYSLSKSFRGHFNNYLFCNAFQSPMSVEDRKNNLETPNKVNARC